MKLLLLFIGFCFISLLSLSQSYRGGSDDGFDSGMPLTINSSIGIFHGGMDDGYGSKNYSSRQNDDYTSMYSGGLDDGFDSGRAIMRMSWNIFSGGIDDGYTSAYHGTLSPFNTQLFSGGVDDGFSALFLCFDEIIVTCLGDFNSDGIINSGDLLVLLAEFGCLSNCSADTDQDTAVSTSDLVYFLTVFNTTCP